MEKGFEAPIANAQLIEGQQRISKENSSKDAKAFFILQSIVLDKTFPSIMNDTTAKQVWTLLQQDMAKVKLIKLRTLRRDFVNIKISNSDSIKDFSTKMLEITN